MLRIITGSAKGKKLVTLEGEATRPTSERIKGAMFSSIQFDIEYRRVLDLFAGSGQLGLEALSRGAESCTFVDMEREAMEIVKKNATFTGFFNKSRFSVADYRNFIRKAAGRDKYDLVFIDPPYALRLVAPVLSALLDAKMIKPTSVIVCESEEADVFEKMPELAAKFEVLRLAKYGAAHVTVLKPSKENEL